MSETELHILKARMRGGVINKARRGELEMGPPVSLVYQRAQHLLAAENVERPLEKRAPRDDGIREDCGRRRVVWLLVPCFQ